MRPLRVTVSGSGRADELGGFLERSEDKKVPHEDVLIVSCLVSRLNESGRDPLTSSRCVVGAL